MSYCHASVGKKLQYSHAISVMIENRCERSSQFVIMFFLPAFCRQPIISSSRPLQIRNSLFRANAYCPLSPQVVPTNSGTSHSVNADSGGSNTGQVTDGRGTNLLAQDVNDSIRHALNSTLII